MRRVIVPPSPGLVSAFGAVIADERVDRRATVVRRLDRPEATDVARRARPSRRERRRRARRAAPRRRRVDDDPHPRRLPLPRAELRAGGAHVPGPRRPHVRARHRDRARRARTSSPASPRASTTSTARPTATTCPTSRSSRSTWVRPRSWPRRRWPSIRIAADDGTGPTAATRRVLAAPGEWVDAAIVARATARRRGARSAGPAIIEEPDSTTYVPPGFTRRGPSDVVPDRRAGRDGARGDDRDRADGERRRSTASG